MTQGREGLAELTTRLRGGGASVRVSAEDFAVILDNLVENAIAYSPKGSPVSVTRSLRHDENSMTSMVALSVTDRTRSRSHLHAAIGAARGAASVEEARGGDGAVARGAGGG